MNYCMCVQGQHAYHLRYGTSTLTISFVDRIFQECLTYDGEVVSMLVTLCTEYYHDIND